MTLKYVTLVASVIYIGFWKSTLLSIVNVFGLFGGNLPIFRYSLAWYLLAAITVVSTILWGRVYCGRICAFGALTQLMDRVLPAKWRVNVPRAIERRASLIKYGILAGVIIYFIVTGNPGIYPYVEPFWMFGLHLRTPVLLTMLATLLIATVFVRNLYCRFLCPLGAFLGILSKLTVFRIKRWSECKTCRICEKACEWGAIRGPEIIMTECVRCDDCERLYEDTKKCPHHLIIIRKADILARRAGTTVASAAAQFTRAERRPGRPGLSSGSNFTDPGARSGARMTPGQTRGVADHCVELRVCDAGRRADVSRLSRHRQADAGSRFSRRAPERQHRRGHRHRLHLHRHRDHRRGRAQLRPGMRARCEPRR